MISNENDLSSARVKPRANKAVSSRRTPDPVASLWHRVTRTRLHFFLFIWIWLCVPTNSFSEELDHVESAEIRLNEILRQHRFRDPRVSELMVELSDYQDVLLSILYSSEDQASLVEALHRLEEYDKEIRYRKGDYLTYVFNFYAGNSERVLPQKMEVKSLWGNEIGFLNTFKMGRDLNADEREQFFEEEAADFARDGITHPFALTDETIRTLEPEILYNFALHPDGTVMVALERPGDKEYQVQGDKVVQAFTHPNHTILAGAPHQVVLAAGAFMLFEDRDKQIYFISSKSGHFQPTYDSLEHMRHWFADHGIDGHTVIPLPDVDMAQHALTNYSLVEVPVLVTESDAERMYCVAKARWQAAYEHIDMQMLRRLAKGDLSPLSQGAMEWIRTARNEANYMRSAYRLLSADHSSPDLFHHFVKSFGKLKDAIHHGAMNKVQHEAAVVVALIDEEGPQLQHVDIDITSEKAFYTYLSTRFEQVRSLLEVEQLHMDDYHEVKKIARQLGVLFSLLAEDNRIDGRHYFLYRSVSEQLFDVNKLMADVHAAHVGAVLREDEALSSDYVVVRDKVRHKLLGCLDHITLEPPHFDLTISPEFAGKLFKRAVFDWWNCHDNIHKGYIDEEREWHYGTVKQLLRDILNKQLTSSNLDIERAHTYLCMLRRRMQDALDLYHVLDRSHDVPANVRHYVLVLERLIYYIAHHPDQLLYREYAAAWMYAYLADSGWPFREEQHLHSDTQEGIAVAIQTAVTRIGTLTERVELEHDDGLEVRDDARQLAAIFNLARDDGIVDGIEAHRTISKTCYESMARRLEQLAADLSALLDYGDGPIPITAELRESAQHVVNKLLLCDRE